MPGHQYPCLRGSGCLIHFGVKDLSWSSGGGLTGGCSVAAGGEITAKLWSMVGGFRAHHRGRIRLRKEFAVRKAKISACLAEMGLFSSKKAIPSQWKMTNSEAGDHKHDSCG